MISDYDLIFLNIGQSNTMHLFNSKKKTHYLIDSEVRNQGYGFSTDLKDNIHMADHLLYLK